MLLKGDNFNVPNPTMSGFVVQHNNHLMFSCREELIKYYEELSREVEIRERHAQWLVKRHRLDTVRMQFLAQEAVQLDMMRKEVDETSAADKTLKLTETQDTTLVEFVDEKQYADPNLAPLISSGVGTEAPVHAVAAEGLELRTGAQDSSVVRHLTDDVPKRSPEESGTVVSVVSSMREGSEEKSRKTWGSPEEGGVMLKYAAEESESDRKRWEAPPEGGIKLAESQLPHGHPSESSIQFALYSDKQLSHEKEAPVDRRRPSHSVAQGILYGSSETDTAVTSPAHGHPSNSTAQSLLYGADDATTVTTPSTHGHPSNSTAQLMMYGEAVSEVVGVPSPNCPRDINVVEGEGNDSVFEDMMHLSSVRAPTGEQNAAQLTSRVTRSQWGHPSNASVDKLINDISTLGNSQSNSRGTPAPSVAQDILYPRTGEVREARGLSSRGTPPLSVAQDILYPRTGEGREARGLSSRGTPPLSVAQNIMYPGRDGLQVDDVQISTRGHEPAARIKGLLYPLMDKKGENSQAAF